MLKDLKRHRLAIAIAGACPPGYGNIETGMSLLPNTSKYETPSLKRYRFDREIARDRPSHYG